MPALHGLSGGLVKLRVTCRTFYLHGFHPTLFCHPDLEQNSSFDTPLSGCFWIAGFHLIPSKGTGCSPATATSTTPTAYASTVASPTAAAFSTLSYPFLSTTAAAATNT